MRTPACSAYGQIALQAAASRGHLEIVQLLLSAGANELVQDLYAMDGIDVNEPILLREGADVNAAPSRYAGLTVLQGAAAGCKLDSLLEQGAPWGATTMAKPR
ncbi:hypothetical protein C8R45DRAFT_1106473 [Mycena sanguinolenta]|nr:hypothetical protein C8R45DRAFT_1106473 [Mycena sanguinolenta]